MASNSNFRSKLRIALGSFSALAGFICLSRSSFFKAQFEHAKTLETLVCAILAAFVPVLVFLAPRCNSILEKIQSLHSSMKIVTKCFFLVLVWVLMFLIKYPRFNIHSNQNKCSNNIVDNQGAVNSSRSEINLYSVGAFALLAVVLSSERHHTIEVGFFSFLIGLTIEASMEIPGNDNGPNLWYMLVAALYCLGLIIFRQYMSSWIENRNHRNRAAIARDGAWKLAVAGMRNNLRKILELLSAAIGVAFLFLCPFTEDQFEDATDFKGVCFIVFTILLACFMPKAPQCRRLLAKACSRHFLVKTAANSILLMIVSGVIFLTKFPRFKVHIQACIDHDERVKIADGKRFDSYSAGAFALFALTISSERQQPMELGIFSFLIEMTMNTSIELNGNGAIDFWYVSIAFLCCVVLLSARCYLDWSKENIDSTNVTQQESNNQDRVEIVISGARKDCHPEERRHIESTERSQLRRRVPHSGTHVESSEVPANLQSGILEESDSFDQDDQSSTDITLPEEEKVDEIVESQVKNLEDSDRSNRDDQSSNDIILPEEEKVDEIVESDVKNLEESDSFDQDDQSSTDIILSEEEKVDEIVDSHVNNLEGLRRRRRTRSGDSDVDEAGRDGNEDKGKKSRKEGKVNSAYPMGRTSPISSDFRETLYDYYIEQLQRLRRIRTGN